LNLTETRESGFLRFRDPEIPPTSVRHSDAHEKQYRLSLLQVFATRQ